MKDITKTRTIVTTFANQIDRDMDCKDMPFAFKKAWELARAETLTTKIAGVTYGSRQRALNRLGQYKPDEIKIELERDAENTYDKKAIKIQVSVNGGASYHLGYLPKRLAALLAPLIDKGFDLDAKLKTVTGGVAGRETYGALININL